MHLPEWTLDALIAEVAHSLAQQRLTQRSKRVQEAPDVRTVRYYASLDLIDPPIGIRHRRKLYSERHRQQLVAIKRLQAEGWGLQEIRNHLFDCGPGELAALARASHVVPEPPLDDDSNDNDNDDKVPPAPAAAADKRTVEFVPGFVRQDVDDVVARRPPREEYVGWDASSTPPRHPDTRPSRPPLSAAARSSSSTSTVVGIQLGDVQLTFPSAAALTNEDRQRLENAAQQLLAAVGDIRRTR